MLVLRLHAPGVKRVDCVPRPLIRSFLGIVEATLSRHDAAARIAGALPARGDVIAHIHSSFVWRAAPYCRVRPVHAGVDALESKEIVSAMGGPSLCGLCLDSGRARAVAIASHPARSF